MRVFKTVAEAIRAGFEVYDKIDFGYMVRIKLASGLYARAIVDLRK